MTATILKLQSERDPNVLPRRFEGIAYTGAVFGGDSIIDLGTTRAAAAPALLYQHDHHRVIGVVERMDILPSAIQISGSLYTDLDPTARDIATKARAGFPWQLSIGVYGFETERLGAGRTALINGVRRSGPLNVLKGGTVREVSIVALGADADTTVKLLSAKRVTLSYAEIYAKRGQRLLSSQGAAQAALDYQTIYARRRAQ